MTCSLNVVGNFYWDNKVNAFIKILPLCSLCDVPRCVSLQPRPRHSPMVWGHCTVGLRYSTASQNISVFSFSPFCFLLTWIGGVTTQSEVERTKIQVCRCEMWPCTELHTGPGLLLQKMIECDPSLGLFPLGCTALHFTSPPVILQMFSIVSLFMLNLAFTSTRSL